MSTKTNLFLTSVAATDDRFDNDVYQLNATPEEIITSFLDKFLERRMVRHALTACSVRDPELSDVAEALTTKGYFSLHEFVKNQIVPFIYHEFFTYFSLIKLNIFANSLTDEELTINAYDKSGELRKYWTIESGHQQVITSENLANQLGFIVAL